MKWSHKYLLRRLLLRSSQPQQKELTRTCYEALIENHIQHYGSSRVLTKNLAEIYERRSEYKHLIAEGFGTVLPKLKASTDEFTRIHGFTAGEAHYTIFTNVSTTNLLGIIVVKGSAGKFRT